MDSQKDGAGAVVVLEHPVTGTDRRRIVELAVRHRLPSLLLRGSRMRGPD